MSETETAQKQETLYEILGVPENATTEDIKRAYYSLIRKYPFHRFPDVFERLTDAGTILTDPRRRGEYDQFRRSGKRVQVLVDQATGALERDNQKAIAVLKNAIVLAPDLPRPRHMLAHVLMKAEEYGLAEKQYRWLINESPRDENLRFKRARCLYLQGQIAEAEKELLVALRLNPRYHDALMLAARIYEEAGRYDWAREALEKAVANDDRENFADSDALLRIYVLHLLADYELDHVSAADRLLAVVPAGTGDSDRERATKIARKVLNRAREFFESEQYNIARRLLALGKRIGNAEEEVRAAITDLARLNEVTEEAKAAEHDDLILPSLKEVFVLKYRERANDSQRRARLDAVLMTLRGDILRDPRGMGKAIEFIRREYPLLAEDQSNLLAELQLQVNKRMELLGGGNPQVMPGGIAPPRPAPALPTSTPTPPPTAAPTPAEPEPTRRRSLFDLFRSKK